MTPSNIHVTTDCENFSRQSDGRPAWRTLAQLAVKDEWAQGIVCFFFQKIVIHIYHRCQ